MTTTMTGGITVFITNPPPQLKSDPMKRATDEISNVVRASKHPFRQADDQPGKPQRHRYERRKVKEYMKLPEWQERDE